MKEKRIDENKITGFFDKDTEIKGDLSFKGSFRVDGHFKGKINSDSVLVVGENGKIQADIKIGFIVINGEVKGNIQASERVEVNANGRVIGTISSPKLVVEEGAYLEANCQTSDKPVETQPAPPKMIIKEPIEKKEVKPGSET